MMKWMILESVEYLSRVSVSLLTLSGICWKICILGLVKSLYIVTNVYSEIGLGKAKPLPLLKKSRLYVDLVQAFSIMKELFKLEQDK